MVDTGATRAHAQILLVERNASVRESISAYLRAKAYSVHEARGQADAIIQLESKRYDLVVAQISLASASELTFLVWLARRQPQIPVIGTSHEEPAPEMRERATDLGVHILLVEPYHLVTLLDAVRRALTSGISDILKRHH